MSWGMRKYLENQATAVSQTVRLVTLFGFATLITALCTSAVLTYMLSLLLYFAELPFDDLTRPLLAAFAFLSVVTGSLMAGASWYKMRQLQAGGKVIALDLGGVLIDRTTNDRDQRRVLNVVEELAIASNLPVPEVYLLDMEPGINAFAAGLTPDDAVIGVTRGCITRLNRDQLQGVIAHEFSHILNGDMRLNLRLVGALFGILGIMLAAETMLVLGHEIMTAPRSDNEESEWGTGLFLIIAGAFLWPVGLIGAITASVIMSATSRQREFLADASAVELTRLPDGLAGALKILAGYDHGSRVRSAKAKEASHFFFAAGSRMLGLMATHPPLEDRIRALDPRWDGVPLFEEEEQVGKQHTVFAETLSMFDQPKGMVQGLASTTAAASVRDTVVEGAETGLYDNSSASTRWYEQYAAEVRQELPAELLSLLEDPDGVQVVLQALWLARVDEPRALLQGIDSAHRRLIESLLPLIEKLEIAHQTLVLDETLQSLSQQSPAVLSTLQRAMSDWLQTCPDEDDLTRWSWRHQIRLAIGLDQLQARRPVHGTLAPVREACEILLSMICHTGNQHEAMAGYAFQRAAVHLELPEVEFWPRDQIHAQQLDVAVDLIAETAPRARRKLYLAIGCCVTADQGISATEADLLRGICALLGLPKPAVLPGQPALPGT